MTVKELLAQNEISKEIARFSECYRRKTDISALTGMISMR